MKRLSRSKFALVAMLLSGCAVATPAPTGAMRAASMDASTLSVAIDSGTRREFTQADRNGDGFLTPDELPDLPPTGFAQLDTNHDGKLSYDEAIAQMPSGSLLASLAAHALGALQASDGSVTSSELVHAINAPAAAEAPMGSLPAKGNPIIMIPGYAGSAWLMLYFRHKLAAEGYYSEYMNLFPNIGDITIQAAKLKNLVDAVKAKTGAKKVDLIGHSMGGLIARYYLENLGGMDQVGRLVTISTPHHGTLISFLGPGLGAEEMHPGSAFLDALNAHGDAPGPVVYTAIRGGLDEIVIPHSSAIQVGADNYEVPLCDHGTILLSPTTWGYLNAAIAK